MGDCESLFTHRKNRKTIAEKYLVRHFLRIQQFIEEGDLDNVYWIPGTENPADGLTKIRSEMGPILALLETGRFQPGLLRPLKGLASRERQDPAPLSRPLLNSILYIFLRGEI